LIENDPSTLGSTLIAHIKSTEGYTTTYRKAWLAKQKAIKVYWSSCHEPMICPDPDKKRNSKGRPVGASQTIQRKITPTV